MNEYPTIFFKVGDITIFKNPLGLWKSVSTREYDVNI